MSEEKIEFWMGPCGALLCNIRLEGCQVLEGPSADYYGGRYFIGETITEQMAKEIAKKFNGEFRKKR